jgi:predicted RNase H-like nuclease (RuvC/YqgF family)
MDEINRLVGGLKASVENLTDSWKEQDRKATEGRRELYRKVDELSKEVTQMWGQVEQLGREFAEMKPAVRQFEDGQHRTAGATYVIRILWTALVAGIGAIAYVIHDWLAVFWPPKH